MEDPSIKLARELHRVVIRLVYFQDDDEYSHVDKFQEVTSWIYNTCRQLIQLKGTTVEEEAEICLSVLEGYSATIRDEINIEEALNRSYKILQDMEPSVMKCSLLVYCYGEAGNKALADEAKQIMDTWSGRELTEEETHIKQLLADMEYNEAECGNKE
jgi:hypothetical protein